MVLEVDYRRDETLQSLSARDDDDSRSVQSNRIISCPLHDATNARDSSHTHRDCGDDTRQSIQQSFQTNRSILNCTSEGETDDEEEESEEPGSFLFDDEDFHSPLNQSLAEQEGVYVEVADVTTSTPTAAHKLACCVNDKQWWLDTSLQNVTDSFVSLCSSRPDEACGNFIDVTDKCSQKLRHQVQTDLLHLLGCDAPGDFWSMPMLKGQKMVKHSQPVRRTPRQRAEHIRKIRHDLIREETPSPNLLSTRSFQHLEWDIDPIQQGYDSDPEEAFPSGPQEPNNEDNLMATSLLDEEDADDYHFFDSHREKVAQEYQLKIQDQEPPNDYDREIYETVQEALNYTWTLTWHAEDGNPMLLQFWIERGTMLNLGTAVVEPKFMWRQVYQPALTSKRILSESATKPMELRVLNVCRIVEVPSNLDRNKYPMARTACSFFVKTCRDQCFLFEASSPQEKDQMIRSWKLVVARLASLAVTEDMEAMAKEFFTPAVTWQMLTAHDG